MDLKLAKELIGRILDDDTFVEAIFRGAQRGKTVPWEKITVRPVMIRGEPQFQFSFFDGRQDFIKNYQGSHARNQVEKLLPIGFKSIQVKSTVEDMRVQFSKRGRPITHYEQRSPDQAIPLPLAHDRQKSRLIPDDKPVAFLQEIGVMTADGQVRANQRRKFRQINEFLRIIDENQPIAGIADRPLRIVDLGCGNAALTFAAYYYFNHIKGVPATAVGVDVKGHLLEKHRQTAASLSWNNMVFETATIEDYQVDTPPDMVLALHACDTATDDALAQAVHWGSKTILSVPCCHHDLQVRLSNAVTPPNQSAIFSYGILRERQGDILTDTFRAHLLRMHGYRADVIEFASLDATPRNLMIRAVINPGMDRERAHREYMQLKAYWQVTPYLEELLIDIPEPIIGQTTERKVVEE